MSAVGFTGRLVFFCLHFLYLFSESSILQSTAGNFKRHSLLFRSPRHSANKRNLFCALFIRLHRKEGKEGKEVLLLMGQRDGSTWSRLAEHNAGTNMKFI
jgi:hypothetical protein